MLKNRRMNKKGVDAIISYILLITLGLALAVFVFNWLRGFVPNEVNEAKCPEGVSLIITNFNITDPVGQILTLEIQNRGRFNASGFYLRVNNLSEPAFGTYLIDKDGVSMPVGSRVTKSFNYSKYILNDKNMTLKATSLPIVEIQPFVWVKGHSGPVLCSDISRIKN